MFHDFSKWNILFVLLMFFLFKNAVFFYHYWTVLCAHFSEIYPPDLLEVKKMIPLSETVTESLLETDLLPESSILDQTIMNDQDFGADYE